MNELVASLRRAKRALRRVPEGDPPHLRPHAGGDGGQGGHQPVHAAQLRAGQAHAPREADGSALRSAVHHRGGAREELLHSPNQAMHYPFTIAKAANLMPEDDAEAGTRLRTQGNMMEWGFVCLTDKIEEPDGGEAGGFRLLDRDVLPDGRRGRPRLRKSGRQQINVPTKLSLKA